MATEFVIYTDESVKDGKFFSNFYGGALIRSSDLSDVLVALARIKADIAVMDVVGAYVPNEVSNGIGHRIHVARRACDRLA